MHELIKGPPGVYRNENLDPYVKGEPYFKIDPRGQTNSWMGYIRNGNLVDCFHRENGPAHIISNFGSGYLVNSYYLFGLRHRLDGPAYETFPATNIMTYHINGESWPKELFEYAAKAYKERIIAQLASVLLKEQNSNPLFEKLLELKPEKADKIRVVMDMCAEWGL